MSEAGPDRFMRRALVLARRGCGRVEPNPMVGAVMVRGNIVVAEGYHERFGGPHAEVNVLGQCRKQSINPAQCDLFVTLEPCSHHGKTPACTDALIEAGVKRVFVAMVDPNPAVAGEGINCLRRAGHSVHVGLCNEQAKQLNEPFIKCITTNRPWVIAKWAQTLDGRVATREGDSKWISNRQSRRLTHRLRGRVDAIMVGIGTVLADDCRLTARGVKRHRIARRVVVDPNGRLPVSAGLFDGRDGAVPLTVAVNQQLSRAQPDSIKALVSRGVEVIGLPPLSTDDQTLALDSLFKHLAVQYSATNVMVEGGPTLLGSLWQQRLVDQVLAFVAPKFLGDPEALSAAQGLLPVPVRIDQAKMLELRGIKRIGDDVLLDYRVVAPSTMATFKSGGDF